jgi:hypothetical protein
VSPEEFVREGEALFGKRWKAPLSRALDIDPVTIWRYATGQWPIPVVVELALASLEHRRVHRRRTRSDHRLHPPKRPRPAKPNGARR